MKATLMPPFLFLAALSVPSAAAALDPAQRPLFLRAGIPPQVMLDISKDQQLFKKAYNDYADLDGDGQLETGYRHGIDYYGYFDPHKCYTYAGERFEPAAVTADKYCNGQWSGNFLNWATMTRMDAVRKLLYGGQRSTDQTHAAGGNQALTVLERAYLPTDAHAFAKYYNGADIDRLTPFSVASTPTSVVSSSSQSIPAATPAALTFALATTAAFAHGDQVVVRAAASPSTHYLVGAVSCVNGSGISMYDSLVANARTCSAGQIKVVVESAQGSGTHNSWSIENWSQVGVTLCNATLGHGTSQNNSHPPLIRVARGNFALWAANERWQCLWREEVSSPAENTGSLSGATRTNGNRAAISGLYASSLSPNRSTTANGRIVNALGSGDYVARVRVCVPGLIGRERCKQYPAGNQKPIGLLQYYGDTGQIHFGLMTGSHAKNLSGGVLRKNVGPLNDEINVATDGTFTQPATPPASPRTTTSPATPPGIVNSLNYLRIYGYNYGDGTYLGSGGDNCAWQLTGITENACTSWGNPMSEVYFETLRYFAGLSPSTAYGYTDAGSKDNLLGLPQATWRDLLGSSQYCAPLNVVLINASVASYDEDLGSQSTADIGGSATVSTLTDAVGTQEGITGHDYFIGKTGATGNELCDAKTLAGLGHAAGICPEGPTLQGSWLMAGLAWQAQQQRIRSDLAVPAEDDKALKVATYGVQLASNVPEIHIAVAGETRPRVILQPAYRLFNHAPQGGGQLVDMKIVHQTATATTADGMAYLNWEDSEQGGDYDQDVWGVLAWHLDLASNTLHVTTRTIAESTAQPQGFGYIVSGTTQDGPHFHSGIEGFNYSDPTTISVNPTSHVNASGGCNNCQLSDVASTATYRLGRSIATRLQDPLWYAAKWGATDWDSRSSNGAPGSDGIPDHYFMVSNPLGLEQALDRTFTAILETAAASAVASNSTSARSGAHIYQARFNANGWSGQLLALPIAPDGQIASTAQWDAATVLRGQVSSGADSRVIVSHDHHSGVPFTWDNLNSAQRDALDRDAAGLLDQRGRERLAWLRGHTGSEGKSTNQLRQRPGGPLGDIVSATPLFMGPPAAGHSDVDYPGYAAFATHWQGRTPIVWAAANDGMLHGFNAGPHAPGREVLAYVPAAVYPGLSQLSAQGYGHHYSVDGSPMLADAVVGSTWRTVLVGGLNAGGRGWYALDVTDPDTTFMETRAADLVLWEFTAADDPDLGYSYNFPAKNLGNGQARQIVRMNDGRWAALVGNGYGAGPAALFILFLDGGRDGAWTPGQDIIKLVADPGPDNGLSTPTPVDQDGDGKVDVVYAGDLQGHLWKFDLSHSSPGQWHVALEGRPLFTASDDAGHSQPILAPPEATLHPQGGVMLLFGTGKYLEEADASSTAVQTLYGTWDRAGAADLPATAIPGREWLVARTSREYAPGSSVEGRQTRWGLRVTAGPPVVWCDRPNLEDCRLQGTPQAHLGWRLDLPTAGERLTGIPQLVNGVVYLATFIPSAAPCLRGGDGWLMALDYAHGTDPAHPVFDSNGDGQLTLLDDARGSLKTGAALGGATFLRSTLHPWQGVTVLNRLGGDIETLANNLGLHAAGRVSWHEIVE